MIQKDG